ncbi:hypothetical protein BCL76_11537 [Streptomyces sp. CG 926]|uniref:hypothetical protein n=1 Tax=Streptomyces sp. CG 926 TaxID=1882405 RepID=UPI000D6ADC91|nr:hypothetical protein [Streptomyces sp. CG 926]PWK64393.1 hypothetical protein BCL76_11537 [Streptomyces sp. CG 926]
MTADQRNQLHHQYLGLAGQVERLLATSPEHTALDQDALTRWQTLYGPEARTVVERRDSMIGHPPSKIPTSIELDDWITYAQHILPKPGNPLQN